VLINSTLVTKETNNLLYKLIVRFKEAASGLLLFFYSLPAIPLSVTELVAMPTGLKITRIAG
jgi:hypothetical protein